MQSNTTDTNDKNATEVNPVGTESLVYNHGDAITDLAEKHDFEVKETNIDTAREIAENASHDQMRRFLGFE